MMTPDSIDPTPACPRCGYDMRGTTATWTESCPLGGTCTECGLQLLWAEVLVPHKFEPPWCVEFVKPRSRFVWAFAQTIGRFVRPFRFWSALKMSMPIRPARLAAYVAMLLLPVLLAAASVQTVAAVRVRSLIHREMIAQQTQAAARVAQIRVSLNNPSLDERMRGYLLGELRQLQPWAAAPAYKISLSYGAAVAEALVSPWRSTSNGTVTRGTMVVGTYPPPRMLHITLMNDLAGNRSLRNTKAWGYTVLALVAVMWIAVTMPFAFVVLPVSRRRAKVRWAHLVRVGCYGLAIPAGIFAAMLLCIAVSYTAADLYAPARSLAHGLGRYAMIVLLLAWWTAAIRCYLHIPNAWAIPPVLAVLLFLLLLATVYQTFNAMQ